MEISSKAKISTLSICAAQQSNSRTCTICSISRNRCFFKLDSVAVYYKLCVEVALFTAQVS